jgi:hypothetical protein
MSRISSDVHAYFRLFLRPVSGPPRGNLCLKGGLPKPLFLKGLQKRPSAPFFKSLISLDLSICVIIITQLTTKAGQSPAPDPVQAWQVRPGRGQTCPGRPWSGLFGLALPAHRPPACCALGGSRRVLGEPGGNLQAEAEACPATRGRRRAGRAAIEGGRSRAPSGPVTCDFCGRY